MKVISNKFWQKKSFLGKDINDGWFYLVFVITLIILGLILTTHI